MIDAYELYSETHDALPDDLMRFLVDEVCPEAELTKRGKTYSYRWPRLTIRVKAMSARKLSSKVTQLLKYVQWIDAPHCPNLSREAMARIRSKMPERTKKILRRIHRTRLGVVVEFVPKRGKPGPSDRLVGTLVNNLHSIVFYGSALFDGKGRTIIDMFGPYDRKAEID